MNNKYIADKRGNHAHIINTKPVHTWNNEMCTVYNMSNLKTIVNSLNFYDECKNLPSSVTKAQILEIFKKYKLI